MSVIITQCPLACPPCGGPVACPATIHPTPCMPSADPTSAQAPTYTGSIVLGHTATPLTTPLPMGGSVTIGGNVFIPGPGTVDQYNINAGPGVKTCWQEGACCPNNPGHILPYGGGVPYFQGTVTYSYDTTTGNETIAPFSLTADASAGANYTAWAAASFAPKTFKILQHAIPAGALAEVNCCCGWTSCGPMTQALMSYPFTDNYLQWLYLATATYEWVFNSGTGLYDATMTATAELVCGNPDNYSF